MESMREKLSIFKNSILPRYFIATPFLSSLYYFLFSNRFRREEHAVLKGRVKHIKELQKEESNVFTLIRNVHRIEKGLLMMPKRGVFALDYIEETIDAFLKIWCKNSEKADLQYKWFFDVLTEYFRTSDSHEIIIRQEKRFIEKVGGYSCSPNKSIPYYRDEIEKPNISYEEFYKLVCYRRSVRWFLDKKVPHSLVDKAILAANQSPSACNRQPFQYKVIDDIELLKGVVKLPMGVQGYLDGIPMLVVVIGKLDAYVHERDRHLIYIDASLANMTFMLALETLGLGSCSINWPDVEELERKMERKLKLEKHERPIMCMAVGYPDPLGKVATSEKRALDKIRTYNT
jgi:nitroreductase